MFTVTAREYGGVCVRDCCTTENVGQGLALQWAGGSHEPNSVGDVAENFFFRHYCADFPFVGLLHGFDTKLLRVYTLTDDRSSGATPHQVTRLWLGWTTRGLGCWRVGYFFFLPSPSFFRGKLHTHKSRNKWVQIRHEFRVVRAIYESKRLTHRKFFVFLLVTQLRGGKKMFKQHGSGGCFLLASFYYFDGIL